jgi:hypothetical protein
VYPKIGATEILCGTQKSLISLSKVQSANVFGKDQLNRLNTTEKRLQQHSETKCIRKYEEACKDEPSDHHNVDLYL